MNVRQYAETLKQGLGTVLGVYETFAAYTGTDRDTQLTNLINALPDTALKSVGSMFSTTADIEKFVVAAGPILEAVVPKS